MSPPYKMPALRRVGLLAPCGFGNLGDAATQDAMIQNLRTRWPDIVIRGFFLDPADTERRHGIPSYPLYPGHPGKASTSPASGIAGRAGRRTLRDSLKSVSVVHAALRAAKRVMRPALRAWDEIAFSVRVFRYLRDLDALVMCGSGQIADDWGGAWRHPFTMYRWTLLARLAGCQVFFVSVGAGPLRTPLSRWFARQSIRKARFVSYRDETSRRFMESVGLRQSDGVCADLAYSVQLPTTRIEIDPHLVSFGPMPYFDPRSWPQKDAATYAEYLRKITELIRWLVHREYRVELFGSDIYTDALVINDVMATLRRESRPDEMARVAATSLTDVNGLLRQLSKSRFVIASRYHGVLLPHRVGTPALALSYHPKVRAAMIDVANEDLCLDLASWTVSDAVECFLRMVAAEPEIRSRIAARVAQHQARLIAQYDRVFGGAAALQPLTPTARGAQPEFLAADSL